MQGTETLAQLAERYDVHATQIAQWQRQLVARAAEVFATEGERRADAAPIDVKTLHAKISQEALEVEFFGTRARAAPRREREAMINRTHRLAVTRQATLLGLSRASVYYVLRAVPPADLVLMLRDLLRGEGEVTGRAHVRTLRRHLGITAIYQRPKTSHRHRAHPVFPYLLRTLTIDRPNQVWAADITYIPMARGFVFLVAVMDWASRKVLTWRVSPLLTSDCWVRALEDALHRFGTPEIFTTDQRSQFTARPSRTCSARTRFGSAWTGRAARATPCSWSGCGAPSNTKRFISTPTRPYPTSGPGSGGTSPSTATGGRTTP